MSLVVLQSWSDCPPKIIGIHSDNKNDELVYVPDHMGQFVAQEVSNKPNSKVKRSVIIPGRKKEEFTTNKSKSDTALNITKNVIVKEEPTDESQNNQNHVHNNADDDSENEQNNSHNSVGDGGTVGMMSFKLDNKYTSNSTINSHQHKSLHQQQHNRRVNEGRKPTVKPKPVLLRSISTSPDQDFVDLDSTPPSSPVSGRYRNLGPELAACIPKRQLKFGINWMREDSPNSFNQVGAYRRSLNNSTPSLSQDFYSSEEDKISSCFSSSQCSSQTPSPQPFSTSSLVSNISKCQQQQEEGGREGTEVGTKDLETRAINITTSTSKTAPATLVIEPSKIEENSTSSKLKEKVTESKLVESISTTTSYYNHRINRRPPRQRQQLSSPSPPPPPPSSTSNECDENETYYHGLNLIKSGGQDVDLILKSQLSKNNHHTEYSQLDSKNLTKTRQVGQSLGSEDECEGQVEHDKSDVILVEVIRKKLTTSSTSPSGSESVSSCGSDLESEYFEGGKRRPNLITSKNYTSYSAPTSKRNSFGSEIRLFSSSGRKSVDFSDHLEYITDDYIQDESPYKNCNKSHKKENFEHVKNHHNKKKIYSSTSQLHTNDKIFTTICPSLQSEKTTTTTHYPQVEHKQGESTDSSSSSDSTSSNLFINTNSEEKIKESKFEGGKDDSLGYSRERSLELVETTTTSKAIVVIDEEKKERNVDQDNFGRIPSLVQAREDKEPPVDFASGNSIQSIPSLHISLPEEPSNPPQSTLNSFTDHHDHESRIHIIIDKENSKETDLFEKDQEGKEGEDTCDSVSGEAARECQRPRNECQDENNLGRCRDSEKSESSEERVCDSSCVTTTTETNTQKQGEEPILDSVSKVSLLLTQVEHKTTVTKTQNLQNHQQESQTQQSQSTVASVSEDCQGEKEQENYISHSIPSPTECTMDRGKIHQGQPFVSVKIPVQAVNKHVHRSDSSDEYEPDVIWRSSTVRESFRGFCQELLESSSSQSEEGGNDKIIIHVPTPQKSQPQNNGHPHQGLNDGVIEFEDEEIYDDEDDRCSTELSSSDRPETPAHQQTNNSIEYISVLDNIQVTGAPTTKANSRGGSANEINYHVHPKPTKWIISLDLGSRTSGFSYWSHCDPDIVHIGSWGGDGCTHKIPSWILTNMDNNNKKMTDPIHKVTTGVKVGQEALDDYTENQSKNGVGNNSSIFVSQWREFFQLDPDTSRLLAFPYTLESIDDIDTFTMEVSKKIPQHLINFFGRAALSQLQTKFASTFDKSEKIEWIVTVPSCWSSSSRQCIREAAYKSGVVKADDGVNLIEDSMAISIFAAMCGPHENFLALDIGGAFLHYGGFELKYGALHQTLECKSCSLPTPEATFEHLLTQIVSREFILYYKNKYRPGWIELIKNFEKAKCKFDNNGVASHSSGFVFLPSSFVVEFNCYTGMEVSECLQEQNSGITWNENGALSIPPHEMKLILKPTLDFVLNKIESILMTHEFEHLCLTGGFAKSKFLKESIAAKFPELSIVMPKEFANGVVQGSTLSLMPLSNQPKLVIKSPFSIGVGVMQPFDPLLHPEEKKIVKDGKTWCADSWDTLIIHGQELQLNSVINKRSYVGAQPGQSCLLLPLFKSSQSIVPQLVTDKSVQKCCELRFESTKTWQEIDLILSCRASEMVIMAVDPLSTNIVHRVVIDLLAGSTTLCQ